MNLVLQTQWKSDFPFYGFYLSSWSYILQIKITGNWYLCRQRILQDPSLHKQISDKS